MPAPRLKPGSSRSPKRRFPIMPLQPLMCSMQKLILNSIPNTNKIPKLIKKNYFPIKQIFLVGISKKQI